MRLSTFLLLDRDPTVPDDDPLTRAVETCVAAERAGLDGVWVAEHHFRDFGGMPNPAVLLAHVAARTERIRLGPAVSVLPFRDPRLVAEDYGLVDRLSGGRLVMGVGAGTLDFEFEGFGIDPDEKRVLFDRSLTELRRLWSLPADDTTTLNVRPTRPVPLFVASNRPEGAREVGRQALSLLTLLSASAESLAVLESRLREHRRGLEEGGHAPDSAEVAVALFAHVAESAEQARAVARPSFVKFADAHGVPDGASDYDTMEERGTALLGDPDRAIETLHELAALGVDEAILWMSFGGLPVDELARSFACLEQRVRPALAIG